MDMFSTLSTFAATSFALLNPLGMLPIFIAYAAHLHPSAQRWLALLLALTVTGLTLLFLLRATPFSDFSASPWTRSAWRAGSCCC